MSPAERSLPSERRRVSIGALVTAAVTPAVALMAPWQLAIVTGWSVGASIVLIWTWVPILALDGAATKELATREDDSRVAVRGLLIGSATASLVAVMFALLEASRTQTKTLEVLLIVGAVSAVVVSWLTIQTVFTLRYAHRYYLPPAGGVRFPGTEHPDYHDFAYLALTVGMTFQVADTDIESPAIRRVVLEQALLAYMFGAVIVAIAINLVAGIVG